MTTPPLVAKSRVRKPRPRTIALHQKQKPTNSRPLSVPQYENGFCWVLTAEGWTAYFNKLHEWQKEPPMHFTRLFRWSLIDVAWVVMMYRYPDVIHSGIHACETKITGSADEKRQIKAHHTRQLASYTHYLTYGAIP